jgi:RND family efflux transporter MFP subunit
MRRRFLCLLILAGAVGCGTGSAQPKPAPAPVAEKPRVESELARITLSEEAAHSLGIQTRAPRTGEVQDQLLLPGWITVPAGNEVTLTAPVAGYVLAAEQGAAPTPGKAVTEGQVLFRVRPVLSPLEQIQLATLKRGVESELTKARESVTLAEKELTRMRDLHEQKLRSQQDLEQANTRLQHASEDLKSAKDKLALFGQTAEKHTLPPLAVTSPRAGTVLAVLASPGQYVPAAAPLVTVADLSHLWLRVPVPEADLPRVDLRAQARILFRPRPTSEQGQTAVGRKAPPPLSVPHVALVPIVDTARRTADVIYELPEAARQRGLLARDQIVQVGVPVDTRQNESLVPYSAVVFDAHAGAWIYLDRSAGDKGRVYERRRVELGPMSGDEVAIRPPCKPDDKVVVVGAGQLFSREFYKP